MPLWRRRRWGYVLPLVAGVLCLAGLVVYSTVHGKAEQSEPPAAAPPDLCLAIGPTTMARLVPDGVPETASNYSTGPDAACIYSTADGRPVGSTDYGYLRVRLLRYGRIGWDTGAERAAKALAESCESTATAGQFLRTRAFGDEACAAYSDVGDGGTAHGSAVVRRNADLFWVDYYTHPGTENDAQRAVTEVVSAALTGVR
ncbi:hypothetical protein [Nocardia sp. NPDC049149]|uniref:hypothetical protein n=1 Tax=Nocardia sp. NPDC049149 TaxID=3364315 RepID=UPI00372125CC